jgi:carbon monoxide dehydrogenase subunit G
MPTVRETVRVSAPAERVFSFLADHPERAVTFIPGLNRIESVSPQEADVGQTWQYEFNWFGVVFSGNSRCTKLDRPWTYQFQTVTGNPSTWTYSLVPTNGGTDLTLVVDYDVPANMMARFATQGALEKMNQERAAEALKNLKGLIEE